MQLNMKWNDWSPKLDWVEFGGPFGIRRKRSFTEKAVDAVADFYETAVDAVAPMIAKPAKFAYKASDVAAPMIAKPTEMASKALSKTADVTASGLETAGEAAEAVAASSAAAVGAVSGFFGAIFGFFWWLITFAMKTALLVGVAYAGWQWLQSRNGGDSTWGGSSSSGAGYNSTYGSVSPAPATAGAH